METQNAYARWPGTKDRDQLNETKAKLAFEANGVGLLLCAVAASDVFGAASFNVGFAYPELIFVGGMVFAYLHFEISTNLRAHNAGLETLRAYREAAIRCRTFQRRTSYMIDISNQCNRLGKELEAELLDDGTVYLLSRAISWFSTLSMLCFLAGAVTCWLVFA